MSKKYFKELTEEDKEYLIHLFYDSNMSHKEKMEQAVKKFGVTDRSIRRWWKEGLNLSENFSTLPQQLQKAQNRSINTSTDILLVTAAQNKTGVHTEMLKNMEAYAEFLRGLGFKTQIIVAPARYRNPTSPSQQLSAGEWWVDEVDQYLHYGKIQFGDTLISSDSRVRPTAKEPLTGYEVLAKDNNLVIPHSKIHFKTLPRFKGAPLRVMSTTGFVTHKNYSDSKAGDLAYENHSYGFVVVEKKKDGVCHVPRNVKVTSEGAFTDIVFEVKDGNVSKIQGSEGFVWGDIHTEVLDKDIYEKTKQLVNILKPKKQVLHDVLDGARFNPHEKKDMFIKRQKITQGKYLIEDEVEEALDLIKDVYLNYQDSEVYVAISNHDVFLDRLINDDNWKNDLHNSATYLKYAWIQQTQDLSKFGGIFGYLVDSKFKEEGYPIQYVNYGESLSICGYESGSHGDFGVNGSKGSYKSFSRLNTKMIHAHSHSPVIHNGVVVVGVTCKLDQYYNRKGIGSWAHAHCVVHENCKNQLLVFGDDMKISELV